MGDIGHSLKMLLPMPAVGSSWN